MSPLVLSVNCGSSSIKMALFSEALTLLFELNLKTGDVKRALNSMLDEMRKYSYDPAHIKGIGHRVVHGGPGFWKSEIIDSHIFMDLEELVELAPLHNAHCLDGIKESFKLFPHVLQVAVFDTAFHHDMPKEASQYALPWQLSEKYGIRRYGFHGIAHAASWKIYAQNRGSAATQAKVITLHLGNGCSMSAILGGRCLDTSMGFTPAEGLVMSTRAGDIDSGVIAFLCDHEAKSATEVLEILNNQSGLLGVSGISSNMEILLERPENENAQLAVDLFCYRIVKYLGAYMSVLGGVDAVLFSGGIGENSAIIRQKILDRMAWCGWKIDAERNISSVGLPTSSFVSLQDETSTVEIAVVAVDENRSIAEQVKMALEI